MTLAAKKVQVSPDSGTTWNTLPGNTGAFDNQGASADDTVFGQPFKSMQPTTIDGKFTANSYYKGFAGYNATLKMQGTSTSLTAEACSLVSTRVYQVTNAAHRYIDRNSVYVVKDGATDVTVQVLSFDYLTGTVTFKSTYTVLGAVTIASGHYFPMAVIAQCNAFTLTQTADSTDTSDFNTLQGNSGFKTCQQGLKTVEFEAKGFYNSTNGLYTLLTGRTECMIEISPDGAGASVFRGYFKLVDINISGDVGAIEVSDAKFTMTVPSDPLLPFPCSWTFTATTLATAVQNVISAWYNATTLGVRYMPSGSADGTGFTAATCIVTEVTLECSIDGINTFSVSMDASGTQSTV